MREVYVELNGRTVNVMELTREVLTEVVARHEGRNCSRAELLKWVVNGNTEYVIRLEDDIEDGQVFYTAVLLGEMSEDEAIQLFDVDRIEVSGKPVVNFGPGGYVLVLDSSGNEVA